MPWPLFLAHLTQLSVMRQRGAANWPGNPISRPPKGDLVSSRMADLGSNAAQPKSADFREEGRSKSD